MATVNLQELNGCHCTICTATSVLLDAGRRWSISQWLIDNLGDTGRYGYRDYERFGNRISQEGDDDHFDRQDGWTSLTEEVPNISSILHTVLVSSTSTVRWRFPTTKILPRDHIFGDEFYHVDKTGATKHIYDQCCLSKKISYPGIELHLQDNLAIQSFMFNR